MKDWEAVLLILAILAGIVLSIWLWVAGPCELYQWQRAADVPARCLSDLIQE